MPSLHNPRVPYPKERRYRRFELQFPVSLSLPSHEAVRELKAITRNVSIGGMLVDTSDYIPLHSQLSFTMEVRRPGNRRSFRLLGEGEVVRVEPLGTDLGGFAVAVECSRPISEMESYLSAAS
jgi:hypothetical protein